MSIPDKELREVIINAEIQGDIWMPYIRASMQRHLVFSVNHQPFKEDWSGLREALLKVLAVGDFRWCRIAYIYGAAVYTTNAGGTLYRELKINPKAKLINDLFTEDLV